MFVCIIEAAVVRRASSSPSANADGAVHEATDEQCLASIHVANPGDDALIEQQLRNGACRTGADPTTDAIERERRVEDVGAKRVQGGGGLDRGNGVEPGDGDVEAHRKAIATLDDKASTVRRSMPSRTTLVDVPRTGHPHVGLKHQHGPGRVCRIRKRNQQMFAACLNVVDGAAHGATEIG
jgi:hypothetical protein